MAEAIRTKRVVIVDDSRTIQALLEHAFFARHVFRVVGVASDAASAAKIIRDVVPDLVTIDLCMPYIDGAALLEMIGDMPAVCKIMVSDKATSNAALEARLRTLGAAACLSKNLLGHDPERFFAKVHAACRLHEADLGLRTGGAVRTPQVAALVRDDLPMADFGYPVPRDETQRLEALKRKHLANLVQERQFNLITKYAAETMGYPMCVLSFIDADTIWMKSAHGVEPGTVPREFAPCSYAIAQADTFVVRDASKDKRFATAPAVVGGPKIRAYVGQPIVAQDGTRIGVLCLLDNQVRSASKETIRQLAAIADIVGEMLDQRPAMAA